MFFTVKAQGQIVARLRTQAACHAYVARMTKDRGMGGLVVSDKAELIKGKHNEWCQY